MPAHVRTKANNASLEHLSLPTFTSTRTLIRTGRHHEIIYLPTFHLRTLTTVTPWSTVFLKRLRVSQLVKNHPRFMKPENF
jgi:hypothetical protein